MSIRRILFSKIAPKALPVSQWVAKSGDDVAKKLGKEITNGDSIYLTGKYLRMQKPKKVLTQSYPTQQYIDDMLQVGKYDNVTGIYDGTKNVRDVYNGVYNRQRCADALYGFTKGTKVEPVRVTSEKTADVVNNLHRIDYIDTMRMAEATGELPADVLARRKEIIEAFDNSCDVVEKWARYADDGKDIVKKITEGFKSKTMSIDEALKLLSKGFEGGQISLDDALKCAKYMEV